MITGSFCHYFCVLIWSYITVPGVHFIILFTNFLAIYGDSSTHNTNEECFGQCTILPSSPNGGKFYFMLITSFFFWFDSPIFLDSQNLPEIDATRTNTARVHNKLPCNINLDSFAEKLSCSNAFCSRTIGGLNCDPCFNGIWQEFCKTSLSAGKKWCECGDKHPTGSTGSLIA